MPRGIDKRAVRAVVRTLTAEDCAAICLSETTAEQLARVQGEGGLEWEIGPEGRLRLWASQEETAEWLGMTTRHLQRLEERGLPAEGHHASCRYAWPHVGIWHGEYVYLRARYGKSPAYLDIEDAMDAHDRRNAVEQVEIEIRMRRDPDFRAKMETVDREEATEILAVRRRLGSGAPASQPTPTDGAERKRKRPSMGAAGVG
jgi:hypothetical protein